MSTSVSVISASTISTELTLQVVSELACTSPQPLTFGIPVPRARLAGANAARLWGPTGDELPIQTTVLARWPDQSVRWLLLDFIAPSLPAGQSVFRLRLGERSTHALSTQTLHTAETPDSVVIAAGTTQFSISRRPGRLLHRVRVDGADVLEPNDPQVLLSAAHGRQRLAVVEDLAIESYGPVRATVRLAGSFARRPLCRFVARLCFFVGLGLVRIRWTIHNPRRARHRGGLWDLGDAGSLRFRDLSLQFGLIGAAREAGWTCGPHEPEQVAQNGVLEIYQGSSGGENWNSSNHVNACGQVPCVLRGYRVQCAGAPAGQGTRASPVVWLRNDRVTLAAAVPWFWQQFPKAIEARAQQLCLRLFPHQFNDVFELQGGEQKTHTVWLHFGPNGDRPAERLAWTHAPASVAVDSEWTAACGVLPWFLPASRSPDTQHEPLLYEAIDGPNSLSARREVIDEYGWRNYGDLFADHEAAAYHGPAPIVSRYNNQYDVVFGSLIQFLRGGDRRWMQLADALARHVIDIDIYHTNQDRAAYNGGMFWPTDHFKHAATCTHRTYSRANYPSGSASGGGPSNEHNYTTGLLHYYYLTGDPAARDAVLGLADWVVCMDGGRNNPLGLIDDSATGLASRTRDDDYHGPGRGCGNSVNALVDAWLLSGERAYLDKAESLVRRSIHPSDSIDSHDLANVEARWSYTVFLSVLARYLHIKAEHGELDYMYAYGRASLLHYASWMLQHEAPYLDYPERLEYPNETWAAQELRKANVLRQSAAHAPQVLGDELWRRATELSDRAWSDLARFPNRAVTRVIAIILVEGARDAYFRIVRPTPAPQPTESFNFGVPQRFRPQRRRVLEQLRSPIGVLRALAKLSRNGVGRLLRKGKSCKR